MIMTTPFKKEREKELGFLPSLNSIKSNLQFFHPDMEVLKKTFCAVYFELFQGKLFLTGSQEHFITLDSHIHSICSKLKYDSIYYLPDWQTLN